MIGILWPALPVVWEIITSNWSITFWNLSQTPFHTKISGISRVGSWLATNYK
jgi:hypothetical protein